MDIGVAQDSALVLREDRGHVTWLTLNRPERANTLSAAMLEALHAAVRSAADDPAVRVIVLAAAGRLFCAGHDLREIRAHDDPAWQAALFARCSALMLLLEQVPQPVIACVQGAAAAGGCQLVAGCDLAFAAEGVKFGLNGIDLGLFCATPAVPVTRMVGRKIAAELLYGGRLFDAAEAARIGLINEAVPRDLLIAHVAGVAECIAAKLPTAIAIGKALLRRQAGLPTDAAYAEAERTMVANLRLPETTAAIDGFLARSAAR